MNFEIKKIFLNLVICLLSSRNIFSHKVTVKAVCIGSRAYGIFIANREWDYLEDILNYKIFNLILYVFCG